MLDIVLILWTTKFIIANNVCLNDDSVQFSTMLVMYVCCIFAEQFLYRMKS